MSEPEPGSPPSSWSEPAVTTALGATELVAGTVLRNRFQIESKLGAGGMGEVYRARDLQTNRQIALKRMLVQNSRKDDELVARRFREEAAILRRLSAPGVPAFIEMFDDGSQAYLAMEFIEGHSLERLLEISREAGKPRLSPRLVAQIGMQVCRILVYLHSHQPPLIHRDVKPANIIVQDRDDQVFLVDFGLAREITSDVSTKTMVGTAAYAPLEQFQGKPEPRSDIYSLGVTMHQLLTGKAPVPLQVTSIQSNLPDLNEDLARIVNRATRPLADERYRAAADMLNLLEDALPRLSETLATPSEEPSNKVEALMRKWGAGKVQQASPPPLPPVVPKLSIRKRASLVFSPDPGLQRAVKRARRRADGLYRSRTRRLLPWLMVLLALGGCGFYYQDVWARAGPSAAKSARAMFINPETANEWLLEDAAGVAGMGSLEGTRSGRGDGGMELRPSTIVLKSSKVGVVFRAVQPRMLDSWSLQLQITKGDPKVLVFAEPFGIRLDASESRVSVEWVRVQCSGTLESVRVSALSAPYRQELSPLKGTEAHGPIEIDFSIVGKRAKIRVGNGPALTLKVPARAACARCGAMLIPPLTSSEVIVSHWSQQ